MINTIAQDNLRRHVETIVPQYMKLDGSPITWTDGGLLFNELSAALVEAVATGEAAIRDRYQVTPTGVVIDTRKALV